MTKIVKQKIFILGAIFIVAVFFGLTKGSAIIPLGELFAWSNTQILYLRLLRVFTCILAGSGLAVSGIVLQALLRNPLAEPYLLGTSSGASLAAVVAILLGVSAAFLPVASFLGAIFTIIIVYNLARQESKVPVQSIILSGVIVSIAFSGIMVFLISTSSNEALHGLMWWLWGSVETYDLRMLFFVSCLVLPGVGTIFLFSHDLNAISLGEEEAIHLGINVETVKKILFFITSVITAGIVSICGIIGFVGLIIPHIVRLFIGPNHRYLILGSCIAGSAFMILCDCLSRTIMRPSEIPIGVITAFLGAPVFIILLKRKQKV